MLFGVEMAALFSTPKKASTTFWPAPTVTPLAVMLKVLELLVPVLPVPTEPSAAPGVNGLAVSTPE